MGHTPSSQSIHTLLYFGSFDPVTLGHEAVIQAGLDILTPSEILIIPAYKEGWGKKMSSFEDRIAMTRLVIASHPEWEGIVSACTTERDAKLSGITADTLHYLLDHGYRESRLGFLMGTDWIVSFPTWEEWEWMLLVAPAYVALRGEETIDSLVQKLPEGALSHLETDIFFLPEEHTQATKDISSTTVRLHVGKTGHSDLINPSIVPYVTHHGLYLL